MDNNVNNLIQRVTELENFIQQLRASATIPLDVNEAFKARASVSIRGTASNSGTTTTVNESGSSTYSVAKAPTGTVLFEKDGITYKVGYY